MSRILRINGAVTDIDSRTKINLSYRSPLFGDLQKITSNTSYTIKLPLTATNRALINNVNIVGIESGFAYDYFRVDYEQDGLIVIDNGIGYLLSIGDQIEISVVFGGMSSFAKIKDVKLNEMPIPVEQGQIDWYNAQFATPNTAADIMFLMVDYGLRTSGRIITDEHPVVRVSKIISWINEAYGMNIAPIGQGLVVPCVTKKRRINEPYISTEYDRDVMTGAKSVRLIGGNVTTGSFILRQYGIPGLGGSGAVYCIDDSALRVSVTAQPNNFTPIIGVQKSMDGIGGAPIEWYEKDPSNDDVLMIDVAKNEIFQFFIKTDGVTSFRFELDMGDDELTRGEKFDTIHNLPQMKVTDFLKALMQIEGKFPRLTPAGIDWVSIDDLYSNISKAVDWSDKINKVVSLNFKIEDFAQQNKLIWAEDETVTLIDEGMLYVDNKTLDAQKDMVKLPFAASDNAGGIFGLLALVPIYTTGVAEDGSPTINYDEVKSRILEEEEYTTPDGINSLRGIFSKRLCLSGSDGIVAKRYAKYQQVIRQPRVVKCEVLLTTQDIAELDMMRPVYVEQLNGYFAMLSVVTKDNISDVELLKL